MAQLDKERGYTAGLGALRDIKKFDNPFAMHQHLVGALAKDIGLPVKNSKGKTRPHPFFDRELNATFKKRFIDDPSRASCPVCTTIAAGRCTYCLKSKNSDAPRLKIRTLGRRILRAIPGVEPRKLIDLLHEYGRSSEAAREINKQIGWDGNSDGEGGRHLYCGKHYDAMSDLEDYAAGVEKDLMVMRNEVVVWLDKIKEQAKELELNTTAAEEKAKNEKALIRFKGGLSQMKLRKSANETTHVQQDMLEELKEENRALRIDVEELKKEIDNYQCPDCDSLRQEVDTLNSSMANIRRDNMKFQAENEQMQALRDEIAELTSRLGTGSPTKENPLERKVKELEIENGKHLKEIEFLKHRLDQAHHHEEELEESVVAASVKEVDGGDEEKDKETKKPSGQFDSASDIAANFKKLCPLPKYLNLKGKFLKSRKKLPKSRIIPETIMDQLHNIYEKKCIADETDIRAGNEIDSMPEFLKVRRCPRALDSQISPNWLMTPHFLLYTRIDRTISSSPSVLQRLPPRSKMTSSLAVWN